MGERVGVWECGGWDGGVRKRYVRLGPRGPAAPGVWEVGGCGLGGFSLRVSFFFSSL